MTQVPGGSVGKSYARFLPQTVGVVADIAAVSTLIVGGGRAVVWTASFGAMLLGAYVIWKRWGGYVDRALVAGVVVAIAGAGVFGYSLAEPKGGANISSVASTGGSSSTTTSQANIPLTVVSNHPTTTSALSSTTQTPPTSSSSPSGTTWLADLQPISNGNSVDQSYNKWTTKTIQVKSVSYNKVLVPSGSWCTPIQLDFVVGGKYSRLTAMVGIADDSEKTDALSFYVLADDKRIRSIPQVKLAAPQAVDVSIAGASRLAIGIESARDSFDCPGPETVGVWIDPALTPAGT